MVLILLDGEPVFEYENIEPKIYSNVKIFATDKFSPNAAIYINNVIHENYGTYLLQLFVPIGQIL